MREASETTTGASSGSLARRQDGRGGAHVRPAAPGWECSVTTTAPRVRTCAAAQEIISRPPKGPRWAVARSIRRMRDLDIAIHFTDALMLARLRPSVGSVGDALGNAVAETRIGRHKTDSSRDGSPFRTGPLRDRGDARPGGERRGRPRLRWPSSAEAGA